MLPTISRLRQTGATYELRNSVATLADTIWPELWSGQASTRTGFYCPFYQFRAGDLDPRPCRRDEFDTRSFWSAASDAGRRVAVVDVPFAVPVAGLNGVQLVQWGAHDRPYAGWQDPAAEPRELLAETSARYGVYPLWDRSWHAPPTGAACDGCNGTREDRELLLTHLLRGVELSSRLRLDIFGRERWDLFACGFGEYQCAGHHFFGLEHTQPPLATALREVYARLDDALGALVDAAGSDAVVVVLASHGHGPHTGGGQLLPEVLERLGMGSREGAVASARRRLPAPIWEAGRRVLPRRVKRTLHPPLFASPSARAMAVAVDRNCWIRLNLVGREPRGCVQPGAEAEALLDELEEELLLLEDPESGEHLVAELVRPEDPRGEVHPDVPDLVVVFRDDLGLIERCRSPRIGLVETPFAVPAHRTSSHRAGSSRLWLRGPGIAAGTAGTGSLLDIAPTVLGHVDVAAPDWMDGRRLGGAERAAA
jgi:predicted AlkP superfamily phosphohydrolase/phosphomutase